MGTRLKRDQLRAERAPAIARQAAAGRRGKGGETRREAPRPEREHATYSFDLAAIRSISISLVSKGVVLNPQPPPPPGWSFKVTIEVPEQFTT